MFHAGEFWKVQPSRRTFSHSRTETMTGLRKDFISAVSRLGSGLLKLPEVARAFLYPSSGNQTSCLSESTPPFLRISFHTLGGAFCFLTSRQESPLPSMIPFPVMEMFLAR